jgi:hypothetical protein
MKNKIIGWSLLSVPFWGMLLFAILTHTVYAFLAVIGMLVIAIITLFCVMAGLIFIGTD